MNRKFLFALTAAIFSVGQGYAQPGSFDTNFGNGGRLVAGAGSWLTEILLQEDGKIVAAGHVDPSGPTDKFTVVRVNVNGTMDTTFGNEGIVYTLFGAKCGADALAIQPDGKLLVGGYTSDSTSNSGNMDFMVVRYNTDGTLDQSFASGGIFNFPMTLAQSVETIAVLPDGKILIGGHNNGGGGLLQRLTAQGVLDTSFNGTGSMQNLPNISRIHLLDSGQMYISAGGKTGRYNNEIVLDTTFGINGYLQPTTPGSGVITFLDSGEIMGAGAALNPTTYAEYIRMFNSDGTLNTNFGDNGISFDSNLPANILSHPNAIIHSNGIVYVGYSHGPASNYDFKIKAFTAQGLPKENFGNNGVLMFYMINSQLHDYLKAFVIQADGKLIVAGNNPGSGFCFARLNTEESLGMAQLVATDKNSIRVYPNPIGPFSKISIDLPQDSNLTINVYDVKGQMLSVLLDGKKFSAGVIEVPLNIENLAQGIYILEILDGKKKLGLYKVVK